MKIRQKIVAFLSAFMLCSSISVPATASEIPVTVEYGVSPAYENAREAISSLTISSNDSNCTSICTGFSDVVMISIEQTLQKQGIFWVWSDVDGASWTKTSYASVLTMTNTKTGLSSGKYRLKSVFTLTDSSGETETITVYSDDVKVS